MNQGGFKSNFKSDNGLSNFGNSGGFVMNEDSGNLDNSQGGDGPRNKKTQSIRKVTIKQIKDIYSPPGKDAVLTLDGQEIFQVIIVAALTNEPDDLEAASATLNFEDGTGFIDVRFWLQSLDNGISTIKTKLRTIQPRKYYRIVGNLKHFSDKVGVQGVHIAPIEDGNEITSHFLEAINTHFSFTKVKKNQGGIGLPGASFKENVQQFNNGSANQAQDQSFDVIRRLINSTVYDINTMTGRATTIEQIKNSISGSIYSSADIDRALLSLVNEGHLYFEDENTYKALGATF